MRTVSCNKKSVLKDLPEVHFMLSISLFSNRSGETLSGRVPKQPDMVSGGHCDQLSPLGRTD